MKLKIYNIIITSILLLICFKSTSAQCEKSYIYKKISKILHQDSVYFLREFIEEFEHDSAKQKNTWALELKKDVSYKFYIFTEGKTEDAVLNLHYFNKTTENPVTSTLREEKYFNYIEFKCTDTYLFNVVIKKKDDSVCTFGLLTFVDKNY